MSDTDFLKDYLVRNPSSYAPPPPGVTPDTDTVDATQSLEETVNDKNNKTKDKVSTAKQEALHAKAVKQEANDKEKQARLEQEAQAERIAEEERLKKEQRQSLRDKIDDTAEKADSAVRPLIDKVANLKTVGGIGLLVAVLVFLNFVVIQVNANGDTRLKQLWYMLNGQAQIQGRVIPTAVTQGASGDFGMTTPTATPQGVVTPPVVSTASSNGFSNQSSFRNFTGGLN